MSRNRPLVWDGPVTAVRRVGCAVWVLFLGACPSAFAQNAMAPDVTRIVIESEWAGLSPKSPIQATITIDKQDYDYRLTGGQSEGNGGRAQPEQPYTPRIISSALVKGLRDAMLEKPQSVVDPNDLLPAIAAVQPKIDKLLEQAKLTHASPAVAERVAAWRQRLKDQAALAEALTDGFSARHTDDFPIVKVTVMLADGSTLSMRSGSQQYLMLPWKDAHGVPTYSSTIARALHPLLPADMVNAERMEGVIADNQLDEILEQGLRNDISRFQVENEAPDALRALESQFVIASVSLDYWDHSQMEADVRLADSPPNLTLSASLALSKGALKNPAAITDMQRMLKLIQSSGALMGRMHANIHADYSVRYGFPDSWPNKRIVSQFVRQMHDMHALDGLTVKSPSLRGAVLVDEGMNPAYWVVLSDRRAVLWKEFRLEAQITKPCPAFPPGRDDDAEGLRWNDQCIGEVYGSDGRASPKQ